ncbi:MAG: hypothetical protein QOH47_1731 [Sphingomonadales bacterium]|nr:hypothetical protein [Sphingomonadales bacterium]
MRRWLAALLLMLAPCAAGAAPERAPVPAEVEIVRNGTSWTADFTFDHAAQAWVFVRSPLTEVGGRPWRPQGWIVETPGVRLERRGYYDALVAADGGAVPAHVRIRFAPFGDRVAGDYDPALLFTDGAVALYSEQFDAFPLADASAVARIPAALAASDIPYSATRATFRDAAGQVLAGGRRVSAATFEDEGDGSYVLFGSAEPIVTDALILVVDPQLPPWLHDSIATATPLILDRYAGLLGPRPGPKPTIMVSWRGATPGLTSQGGSTLPGLIVMRIEGVGMLSGDARARQSNLWFIAHESAHFWLGQAVHYQTPLDSWITEGGADLLAFRAVAAVDPTYDARTDLQRSIEECVALSAGRGVASALERNEFRAYYACGGVFALVAESVSHRPFDAFVRALIEANRDDRTLTRAEWLAALDRASGDPTLSRDIGTMLDSGVADPKAMIASLFTRAGIAFTPGPDGTPRLS